MADIGGVGTIRPVPAGNGWQWIADAWKLFLKHAGIWVLLFVIFMVILVALGWLGAIGNLAAALLIPILGGGFVLAARTSDQGGAPEIAHLFAGFKEKAGPLAMLGVFNLVALLVIFLIVAVVGVIMGVGTGMGAMMGGMAGGGHGATMGSMAAMSASMLLGFLVMLALSVPIAAALWFAPALIMFRNAAPMDALKASFTACLKNMIPFLIFGLAALGLSIVASIPFGLGWLALGPVLGISVYTGYRDIFLG
ncbi:MAG TPA: BPSS1780 family membrane protein [Burkholderiales bacterium]|nr:BPSS1780 family membrane protein [Burkholderiales bacterium]